MAREPRASDNLSEYEWLVPLPRPSPPTTPRRAPPRPPSVDAEASESAPALYEPGVDVDSTVEYMTADLFPQEAREYLLAREPGDVTLVNRRVALTTRDTEEHADHLLFYHAATAMANAFLADLKSQCDCGACEVCAKSADVEEGRRRVTIADLAPYLHRRWVWYALTASSVTTSYNGSRLFWMADREWHEGKTFASVSPYVLEYAYPDSLKDVAMRALHDRIGRIVNGEARRSTDAAERRRAHDEWNGEPPR